MYPFPLPQSTQSPFNSIAAKVKFSSWKVLQVHNDLYAPPLPRRHTMGLSMQLSDGCCRPFTLIPRQLALNVLPQKGMQQLYNSLDFILSSQQVSLERGHSKIIFGDGNKHVMYILVFIHRGLQRGYSTTISGRRELGIITGDM